MLQMGVVTVIQLGAVTVHGSSEISDDRNDPADEESDLHSVSLLELRQSTNS